MRIWPAVIMLISMPFSSAQADPEWGCGTYRGYMNYWSGGAIVFLILLLGLLGVVVYFILNQKKMGKNYRKYENETVIDILKERYAKGEITKKQFDDIKKALQ